jgi:hypothetical protein
MERLYGHELGDLRRRSNGVAREIARDLPAVIALMLINLSNLGLVLQRALRGLLHESLLTSRFQLVRSSENTFIMFLDNRD